jgi:hypothetical protein
LSSNVRGRQRQQQELLDRARQPAHRLGEPGHDRLHQIERVHVDALHDHPRKRVQPQVVAEDHPREARPAAPRGPEQVRVALRVGRDQLAVGVHQVDGENVLARDSPATLIPALAAAEQVAADADGRAMPRREGESVLRQRRDELRVLDRRLGGGRPGRHVHRHAVEPRQVDQHPAVA